MSAHSPTRVRIVGSGLIGTSIGLALVGHGTSVEMIDSDVGAQSLANDLVQGAVLADPELVILALPTSQLRVVMATEFALNPHATFMDTGSVKSEVLLYVETVPGLGQRFIPTHPMAGREIGGPGSARADLFQGRSWILTPSGGVDADSKALVLAVIALLGASAVQMSVAEHDAAVARVSHLPQIVSSLLAKQLLGAPIQSLELAGQGLRDTSRIAGSDEQLWKEIIYSNRNEIAVLLKDLHRDLQEMVDALGEPSKIEALLLAGRAGKALIPGKHGGAAREYSFLPIVIDDKPGQLAAIFNECATMDVNVEDLSIEHSPGQLSALITLSLSQTSAVKLSAHLRSIGWNVHPIRS